MAGGARVSSMPASFSCSVISWEIRALWAAGEVAIATFKAAISSRTLRSSGETAMAPSRWVGSSVTGEAEGGVASGVALLVALLKNPPKNWPGEKKGGVQLEGVQCVG